MDDWIQIELHNCSTVEDRVSFDLSTSHSFPDWWTRPTPGTPIFINLVRHVKPNLRMFVSTSNCWCRCDDACVRHCGVVYVNNRGPKLKRRFESNHESNYNFSHLIANGKFQFNTWNGTDTTTSVPCFKIVKRRHSQSVIVLFPCALRFRLEQACSIPDQMPVLSAGWVKEIPIN